MTDILHYSWSYSSTWPAGTYTVWTKINWLSTDVPDYTFRIYAPSTYTITQINPASMSASLTAAAATGVTAIKNVFVAGGSIPSSTGPTALGTKMLYTNGYANSGYFFKMCAVSGAATGTVTVTLSCTGSGVTCGAAVAKDSGSNLATITNNPSSSISVAFTTNPTTDPCTFIYIVFSDPESNAIGMGFSYS